MIFGTEFTSFLMVHILLLSFSFLVTPKTVKDGLYCISSYFNFILHFVNYL